MEGSLMETLNWQVVTNLGGWAFVGSVYWYMVVKQNPKDKADTMAAIAAMQKESLAAMKEIQDTYIRESETQREHDKQMQDLILARLDSVCNRAESAPG